MSKPWQNYLLPESKEEDAWELFHENSKLGRLSGSLSDEETLGRMSDMSDSLPYIGYPRIELPTPSQALNLNLGEAILGRITERDFSPSAITLGQVGTLLYHSYGQTRDNKNTGFPRPFRAIPSAGALYPLELYVFSSQIEGVKPALYHYNSSQHCLRMIAPGDHTESIALTLVQPEVVCKASLVVFITALFERSVFKYGNRGYRFALLEAGHLAQNMNLASAALSLGSVNVGGYFDRDVDDFLGIDGVTHSTVYMILMGTPSRSSRPDRMHTK